MVRPCVVGLDLSLTATGVAGAEGVPSSIRPAGVGTVRLSAIRAGVVASIVGADLVMVEGPAFGRAQQMHALGQLAGVVYLALDEAGARWMLVPPASLKKYATGRGNAGKAEVLAAAIRRLGYAGHDDNEADALWLRAIGLDLLGCPAVDVPAAHRGALDKLRLPSLTPPT